MRSARSGFEIKWRDGKGPLPFRILLGIWLLCFLLGFGLLVWRDWKAPHTPQPNFPDESRGRGRAIYYVPTWFNPAVTVSVELAAGMFLLIPIVYGYYAPLHADRGEEEDDE